VEHRLVGAVTSCRLTSTGPSSLDGWSWTVGGVGVGVPGTLLGPEGSERELRFFMTVSATGAATHLLEGGWVLVGGSGWGLVLVIPHPERGCGCRFGSGRRLYVENYTVDASIFVAKFLRAHGGCLGTRNRRRT
jgi:hypothetical protein